MKKDEELSSELYHIARGKGTEPPFSGKYADEYRRGRYQCAVCGAVLFSSDEKFDSGTGWPSFTSPINEKCVRAKEDRSLGMVRTEVACKKCGAHLGHVFEDGPDERGGRRYCINSVSLDFKEEK